MKRTIVWQRIDFSSLEHLVFEDFGDAKKAAGHIVGVTENNLPFSVGYEIEIDAEWRVSSFTVNALDEPEKKISLTSNKRGAWFDANGVQLTEFNGCFDIDLTLTPFTNTLPVKRLNLAAGEQKKISVLYIELPEFNIKRVEQFYTKLDRQIYVYEGYPKDFRAEITFDENDFVVDYPELFKRIYP